MTISEKQIQANRKNAQKATGPKTSEGKTVVRNNARKHGLLSKETLLTDENEKILVEFGKRIRRQLKPMGEMEEYLTDRIVSTAWRLRRVIAIETNFFEDNRYDYEGEDKGLASTFFHNGGEAIAKLSRYETTLERSLFKALHELQRIQAIRSGENVQPPVAVDIQVSGVPEGNP